MCTCQCAKCRSTGAGEFEMLQFEAPPFQGEGELGEWLETHELDEAVFESGSKRPTVLPTLTIRDRPFVVLDRFGFDSAVVPSAHEGVIERIARLIVASRVSGDLIDTVRLVGHTDSVGDATYNLDLAKRRAQSVKTNLESAISALGPVPAGPLNIVVQTLGETRAVKSNATAADRELNRRVAVFLPTTCNSFFAQYDLRFLPGNRVFGIPAHPNVVDKTQRTADVRAIAAELEVRRDRRAAAALAGTVPPSRSLPIGTLRNRAIRLSTAQLSLYREYFPDGRGGIEFGGFQTCFERFANGQLRSPIAAEQAIGIGEPNSEFFFLFAEFAFLCIDSRIQRALWAKALRSFVKAQEIFMHVYRPSPVSPPPAVGAALPVCPTNPQGRRVALRGLSTYRNANFSPTGASPTVGAGQSNAARIRALATKYASLSVARLAQEARDNMRRAQCMP